MISCKTFRHKSVRCHYCGQLGHIKKNCRDFEAEKEGQKEKRSKQQKAATTMTKENSDSESSGLIAHHVLSVSSLNEQCTWIIDLGATCHMCQNSKSFTTLCQLEDPINVALGDR